MKSIYETLAALGAGAILLSGCGSANTKPATSPDVPAATETTPAAAKESGAGEQSSGDAAAGDATKTNDAAMPAGSGAPATTATPAGSSAPATTAAPAGTMAPKAAAAAPKTAAKKPGKKKDAAGGCGEGTCG